MTKESISELEDRSLESTESKPELGKTFEKEWTEQNEMKMDTDLSAKTKWLIFTSSKCLKEREKGGAEKTF